MTSPGRKPRLLRGRARDGREDGGASLAQQQVRADALELAGKRLLLGLERLRRKKACVPDVAQRVEHPLNSAVRLLAGVKSLAIHVVLLGQIARLPEDLKRILGGLRFGGRGAWPRQQESARP